LSIHNCRDNFLGMDFKKLFKRLDFWIQGYNHEAVEEGGLVLHNQEIWLLGQIALVVASVDLDLAQTKDVDAKSHLGYPAYIEFERLLAKNGLYLDAHSSEIWMPEETEYEVFYRGKSLVVYLPKPDYVLLSKAKMAPDKNKSLILEYLATKPSHLFFSLARKYSLSLEVFLDR